MDEVLRSQLVERKERARRAGPAAAHATASDNVAFLRGVLLARGWPHRSVVGEDGAEAAWLIALNADHDPEFQRAALSELEQAAAIGEASPAHVAYLADRVAVNEGLPQRYGTSRTPEGVPHPIDDPTLVDKRRAEVGLSPLDPG
ncbi:DUF6624 domain-containing protein [Bailinhaonella thermotolerans]|uniref:Uncharacterized protein n=1 Tax=Bailinhaonella thermotolerans TaxID=1070861 RepID=A0A3A4ARH1_9ACTN|nr:DUF6624 domain-containing protein [Bailinhaonella thermotolerans]RJL32448.1 hypothetical protein D5H75_12985 [Bailinhaonella thermotolerans]